MSIDAAAAGFKTQKTTIVSMQQQRILHIRVHGNAAFADHFSKGDNVGYTVRMIPNWKR